MKRITDNRIREGEHIPGSGTQRHSSSLLKDRVGRVTDVHLRRGAYRQDGLARRVYSKYGKGIRRGAIGTGLAAATLAAHRSEKSRPVTRADIPGKTVRPGTVVGTTAVGATLGALSGAYNKKALLRRTLAGTAIGAGLSTAREVSRRAEGIKSGTNKELHDLARWRKDERRRIKASKSS